MTSFLQHKVVCLGELDIIFSVVMTLHHYFPDRKWRFFLYWLSVDVLTHLVN